MRQRVNSPDKQQRGSRRADRNNDQKSGAARSQDRGQGQLCDTHAGTSGQRGNRKRTVTSIICNRTIKRGA